MKLQLQKLDSSAKESLKLMGFNGFFWFAWAFGCYQVVYLQSQGFTASETGLLNALSSIVAIFSVSFWGMISDKIGSVKRIAILVISVGVGLFALIPAIPTNLKISSALFLIIIPAMNFFRGSMITFSDNILVRNCNELGLNFGVIRSAGSFLFTIGSLIISVLIPFVGIPSTFWINALLMIPAIVFLFFCRDPNMNSRPKEKDSPKQKLNIGELFKNYYYVSFLLFALFFYIATNCEGNFMVYFMRSIDVAPEKYGYMLAYRATVEIPFLLLSNKLRKRFKLRQMMIAGALLMAVEGVGLCFFANSFSSLIFFSTFFGLGNGLFISASLGYVYHLAPNHLKASAQAFFAAVAAVSGIFGNLLGGVVFDSIGAKPFYFVVSMLFALSILIFFISFQIRKGKPDAINI